MACSPEPTACLSSETHRSLSPGCDEQTSVAGTPAVSTLNVPAAALAGITFGTGVVAVTVTAHPAAARQAEPTSKPSARDLAEPSVMGSLYSETARDTVVKRYSSFAPSSIHLPSSARSVSVIFVLLRFGIV